jgi:hypothetical protein
MRLYREQVEKAQVLEEENKALKAQLEAVGRHVDFFAAVKSRGNSR